MALYRICLYLILRKLYCAEATPIRSADTGWQCTTGMWQKLWHFHLFYYLYVTIILLFYYEIVCCIVNTEKNIYKTHEFSSLTFLFRRWCCCCCSTLKCPCPHSSVCTHPSFCHPPLSYNNNVMEWTQHNNNEQKILAHNQPSNITDLLIGRCRMQWNMFLFE